MNRKSVFIAGVLLIAGFAGPAAEARQWGCWVQADRNVKIRNVAGSQASAAISDWNNMTILNISSVSSGEEIYVFNANSGNTGWGGLATITNYSGCTILRATAQVNTYYYSSSSTAARGIHCQEVGHGFGLDHSNDGGCMGAGYWYSVSNAYRPVSNNVNWIASLYANKDLKHGGEHHGETPLLHANWYHTPRSIGEATRLATDVVVATVNSVTEGDPILSVHPDGVQSIPSQRVHFTVNRTRKGALVSGESFVLFQNGNDDFRFENDPSYKVGSRHLLFLLPREDGTYLVVSPEGRYEVSRAGLLPAGRPGFATNLAGASLQDVLSDVNNAIIDVREP